MRGRSWVSLTLWYPLPGWPIKPAGFYNCIYCFLYKNVFFLQIIKFCRPPSGRDSIKNVCQIRSKRFKRFLLILREWVLGNTSEYPPLYFSCYTRFIAKNPNLIDFDAGAMSFSMSKVCSCQHHAWQECEKRPDRAEILHVQRACVWLSCSFHSLPTAQEAGHLPLWLV